MYIKYIFILLTLAALTSGQPTKCDQTPPHATVLTPSENKGKFRLTIANAEPGPNGMALYTPEQTYVLTLETTNMSRSFRWFMLTAEDPEVDNNIYDFSHKDVEVGTLKTLDSFQSRYSERCASSVENYDNTEKYRLEIHWVSPKTAEKVRIRAMVAENSEVWYTGENLTIILGRNKLRPRDDPPYKAEPFCRLCSEARYEVIFNGRWSRLTHPLHYPSKPDDNGYSHMVGASHAYNFNLWMQGRLATPGLKLLAENADTNQLEREIIGNMSVTSGTRTLIRGKRRHHPYMSEPSHSLFRVDRVHHLFSIAVGMRPSPDWFLGTTMFELCTVEGWLNEYEIPLYPWDAGTMDGISYEALLKERGWRELCSELSCVIESEMRRFAEELLKSQRSMTQPVNTIQRVEVGSFNKESPFYQLNLNDLKPFAMLKVRRLDVYPLDERECPEQEGDNETEDGEEEEEEETEDEPEGPRTAESRQRSGCISEWGDWTPCVPDVGGCGIGAQTRARQRIFTYGSNNENDIHIQSPDGSCQANEDTKLEYRHCFVEC